MTNNAVTTFGKRLVEGYQLRVGDGGEGRGGDIVQSG